MTNKRKSFLLHIDSLDILDDLTTDQSGMLFKAIKAHQKGEYIELDGITKVAFSPFKNQFIRDDEKYKLTCERRAAAGSIGGNKKQANLANASNSNKELAKVADNVSKNKNKSDSDSDSDNEIATNKNGKKVNDNVKFNFKNECLLLGVDKDVLADWLKVRKTKKATNTKTALTAIVNEAKSSGVVFSEAIKISAENGWAGFKFSWYKTAIGANNGQPRNTSKKLSALERVQEANDTRYGKQQRECGLGVGEDDGNMGGTMVEGGRGATIEHVDNESFTDY